MILLILLVLFFWYILQAILSGIFSAATGDDDIGKIIATAIIVIGIIIYSAVNS